MIPKPNGNDPIQLQMLKAQQQEMAQQAEKRRVNDLVLHTASRIYANMIAAIEVEDDEDLAEVRREISEISRQLAIDWALHMNLMKREDRHKNNGHGDPKP